MHAPANSTASIASKSAEPMIAASGLWPKFLRRSGNLSRHSLDATGFANISRSHRNNPRNGWKNYTEARDNCPEAWNNYPGACGSYTRLPASCFDPRYNPTDGLANCPSLPNNPTNRLNNSPEGRNSYPNP